MSVSMRPTRRAVVTKQPDVSAECPWNVSLYQDGEYVESHGAESHDYAMACADDWTNGGEGWG